MFVYYVAWDQGIGLGKRQITACSAGWIGAVRFFFFFRFASPYSMKPSLPRSGFLIPQLIAELEFWIPIVSEFWIPKPWIQDITAKFCCIPNSTSKNFPDSGHSMPLRADHTITACSAGWIGAVRFFFFFRFASPYSMKPSLPRSGFLIPQLIAELEFWIPIVSEFWIPKPWIQDITAKFCCIPNSTSKNFPDSGHSMPLRADHLTFEVGGWVGRGGGGGRYG